MSATMIRLERVSKSFGTVRAVQDVTLEIGGASSSHCSDPAVAARTTLLRLIAGFETPDRGTVRLGEKVVAGSAWVRRSGGTWAWSSRITRSSRI